MLELNKLYLGDCSDVLKNIDNKSIDLVVIDPPYKITQGKSGGAFGKDKRDYHGEISELTDGINNSILDELCRIMKKINIYIWCNKNQLGQFISFFESKGCFTELLTWHKTNPVPTCNEKYLSDTEYLLFFKEKGVKIYGTYATKKKFYVTQTNKSDKKLYNHPTIKPLEITQNIITNSSLPNDIVLDCYAGSGTSCVGARNLGRNFIGIEKDQAYYDIAINRLNNV